MVWVSIATRPHADLRIPGMTLSLDVAVKPSTRLSLATYAYLPVSIIGLIPSINIVLPETYPQDLYAWVFQSPRASHP